MVEHVGEDEELDLEILDWKPMMRRVVPVKLPDKTKDLAPRFEEKVEPDLKPLSPNFTLVKKKTVFLTDFDQQSGRVDEHEEKRLVHVQVHGEVRSFVRSLARSFVRLFVYLMLFAALLFIY